MRYRGGMIGTNRTDMCVPVFVRCKALVMADGAEVFFLSGFLLCKRLLFIRL